MKPGCIYSKNIKQGVLDNIGVGFCQLNKCGRSFRCSGSVKEKEKCPEWGTTFAADEYYKKKLKSDKARV